MYVMLNYFLNGLYLYFYGAWTDSVR